MKRKRAVTLEKQLHLQNFDLKAEALDLPLAEQERCRRWTLTIDLVYATVDDVGPAVEDDVANAKALPVSKQANEVLTYFAATDVEAQCFGSRLDVQEA